MTVPTRLLPFILCLLAAGVDAQLPQATPPSAELDRLSALVRGGSFQAADDQAAALLKSGATDPQTLAVCGLAVLGAGRVREAEGLFRRSIAKVPDNPEAHLGLGRVCRVRNDLDGAIEHLRRAVQSARFEDEAVRQLWRAAWERGRVSDLAEIRAQTAERLGRGGRPLPSLIANGWSQVRGLAGKRLFEIEGRVEDLRVPLTTDPRRPRIQMVTFRLNGTHDYPFDIDSASADFMTVSPLLAEELGLALAGNSSATGVGTEAAPVRFSMLDRVELGSIAFRNVPVMVSDLHPFRGQKKGLIGTGLLRRFNVTIDVRAGLMDLTPLDRPELLAAQIAPAAVAADLPLLLFDATTIEATLGGAPPALYILDSAAATHLVDRAFFETHLRAKTDPAAIRRSGIQGAQGAQFVNRIDGLSIGVGALVFPAESVHEFPMGALNAIAGRYAAGLLGNPILWPYRVHMNFRRGRLILERYPGS
jgi:hypothetical protein